MTVQCHNILAFKNDADRDINHFSLGTTTPVSHTNSKSYKNILTALSNPYLGLKICI